MRRYEMMLILAPDADERAVTGATDRVSNVIGTAGGEILNVDRWGRRRFTFEINKLTEGQYLVLDLRVEPTSLRELERVLTLADEVVRYKILAREDLDAKERKAAEQGRVDEAAPGDEVGEDAATEASAATEGGEEAATGTAEEEQVVAPEPAAAGAAQEQGS